MRPCVRALGGRVRRAIVLACTVGFVLSAASASARELRFRMPAGEPPPTPSRLLSEEERKFLAALPEVRVAIPNPPPQPYELVSADGEVSGIHPDMLVALARAFGIRLRPVETPGWSATLEALWRKEADLVMTLGVTAERLDYLAFTLGATPLPGALFGRKGAEIDPARTRFAVEQDFLAADWIRTRYPESTILTVPTTIDAMRAVADGRADAYLGSLLEASDWLAREPVPGVELLRSLPYGTGYYHFGVRKDWAPLAVILNKGIQSLRTSTSNDLAAQLAGLAPAGVQLPEPMQLDAQDAERLALHPVWRVGAVRGLALLNDIDERGLHSGIGAEYTELVARQLGVAMQPVAFENVGAMLEALRRGEIDMVPFLTRTPGRAAEFAFSAPYVEMPYIIVARSDGPLYWDLASLRGKRLALAQQHPLREVLARDHPDIRIVDARDGNDAMDRVLAGEAEAAVEVKLFANLRIHGDSGSRLRAVAAVQELPAQFHFATTRAQAPLIALVDRALARIPPQEQQRILRRWVAVDLQPAFPWRRHAPVIAVAAAALLALGVATAWWLARLRREVAARRRSEELLSDIAATVPGVAFRYVLGPDGALISTYFTPGAKVLFGIELDPHRTVLAAAMPYLAPEVQQAATAAQEHSEKTGERFKITVPFRHPDGRERWLHVEAVRTDSHSGRKVWTGYVVDVTSERELQSQLAREAEARTLMLASASHELRAPTHALSLALQSMPSRSLDAEQSEALRVARGSAQTLVELLNDVLEAARSPGEALALRPRTVALRPLIDDVAGSWRAAAATKGLGFDLDVGTGLPDTLMIDPLRLKQVLTNLLSNACKYTPSGRVGLRVDRLDDGALEFTVHDTGIGIASSEQARVFEPYALVDDPRAAATTEGRTGLGLAVSRRLAAMMGGSIRIESAPGEGTVATLTLPPQTMRTREAGDGAVLLCDDDATSRLLLAHMLRRAGYDVIEAADAGTALHVMQQEPVQALVTDLDLPGMNGLDLIREVRAAEAPEQPRLPVVVCSGSLAPAVAAPQGVSYDAFLLKPVNLGVLTETLRDLGVRSRRAADAAPVSDPVG